MLNRTPGRAYNPSRPQILQPANLGLALSSVAMKPKKVRIEYLILKECITILSMGY